MSLIVTARAAAACLALGSLLAAGNADAAGRGIIWIESGVQENDNAGTGRIWMRESGDEPDTGYWVTEQQLVSGLNTGADVSIDVLNDKLYWTDSVSRIVGQSDLDGGNARTLFIADPTIEGIAVDPGTELIYFTVFATGLVRRGNQDGSEIVTLIDQDGNGSGIALDVPNGKIYYALVGAGEIHRMNLDGSGDETLITTVLPSPRGIALDLENGFIYWAEDDDPTSIPDEPDNSAIYRADLDGNNVELLVDTEEVAAWGIGIDPFRDKLYWAAPNGLPPTDIECLDCRGSIWIAEADGSDPQVLFFGAPGPKGLVLEQRIAPCRAPGKSKLNLRPQVKFKWNGGDAVPEEAFGDPTTDTNYYLCFFDEEQPLPETDAVRDTDTVCTLAEAGDSWRERGKGFRRRAPGRRGITKVDLRAGAEGKARVRLRGKIIDQPTKPFDQEPEFVVQVVNSNLECWEGVYQTPPQRNDGAKFTDRFPD